MKTPIRGVAKSLALSLFAVAVLALGQRAAQAQVRFTGSTTGSLVGSPGLTFTGSSFNVVTSPTTGQANLGSVGNFNNLGQFTAANPFPADYTGSFTLNVTFTVPEFINDMAAGAQTFTAQVRGTATGIGTGGATIDFDPASIADVSTSQTFSYSSPSQNFAGNFTLFVNGVDVTAGDTVPLTGRIVANANPIPEPATMVLLGTGLAGVAGAARRRMKNNRSSDES